MKKPLVIYCVFLHLIILLFVYRPSVPERIRFIGREKPDAKRSLRLELLNSIDSITPENSTIFLGDSLIEKNPLIPVNFGVGGDTAKGLAERIEGYQSPESAKAIVLQIGTNDALKGFNPKDFENLASKLPDRPLIWFAVPPVDSKINTGVKTEVITQINQKIKELCLSKTNCRFVDLSSELSDENGDLKHHTGDGVHFSKTAYEIWNNKLAFILESPRSDA